MACNCGGKNRNQTRSRFTKGTQFTLLTPDGKTQTFGSRLEAEAEYVRQGRQGIIKPVGGN